MFNGRYGIDKLNTAMIFSALAVSVINVLVPDVTASYIFSIISTALIVFTVFRMFSKNYTKRHMELQWYLKTEISVKQWWWGVRAKFLNLKEKSKYRYYTCPRCLQKLRVPKGKGKIRVTCTKCGNKFETRS